MRSTIGVDTWRASKSPQMSSPLPRTEGGGAGFEGMGVTAWGSVLSSVVRVADSARIRIDSCVLLEPRSQLIERGERVAASRRHLLDACVHLVGARSPDAQEIGPISTVHSMLVARHPPPIVGRDSVEIASWWRGAVLTVRLPSYRVDGGSE